MKVYYAHSIGIYNTPQEERDLKILENLGFEVFNPNSVECDEGYREMKARTGNGMGYFYHLVRSCDALVFRAHPDGTIPAGVVKEIKIAEEAGMPVFELPSSITRRSMSVDETREYLCEVGAR